MLPSFSISADLCPGVLLWDLGFEPWKAQSQTPCCVFAGSESTSNSAVCVMSFYFTCSFFQVKTDAPSESWIYPMDAEEGEGSRHRARQRSAKEVICPWENPTESGRVG